MFAKLKDPEPFFCNICGGPATSRRLIKASSSVENNSQHHVDSDGDMEDQDSDDDFDEETDVTQEFYSDYCDCSAHRHPVCMSRAAQYESELIRTQQRNKHTERCNSWKGYDAPLVSVADTKVEPPSIALISNGVFP
jgi:hypothetical protein